MTAAKEYKKKKEVKSKLKLQKKLEKLRTPDEIQTEYNKMVSIVGEKQYRCELLKEEILQINRKLYELNNEYAQSTAAHTPKAEETAREEATV